MCNNYNIVLINSCAYKQYYVAIAEFPQGMYNKECSGIMILRYGTESCTIVLFDVFFVSESYSSALYTL